MNNSYAHTKLVDDILEAIGSLPRVRAWKRPVGFDRDKGITYGQEGEPDIEFVIGPQGRMGGVEVKTGTGRLSKSQVKRHAMLEKFGVALIVGRTVPQVLTDLQKFL